MHAHTHTYICINIYTRVDQKVLRLTQVLDISYTSQFNMGLTCTEIKVES